jgi:hypothetical protein
LRPVSEVVRIPAGSGDRVQRQTSGIGALQIVEIFNALPALDGRAREGR